MIGLLSLGEGGFDTAYQPNVLIDRDSEGEDVLLGLTVVEFLDAELEFGEALEGTGEGGGKFD